MTAALTRYFPTERFERLDNVMRSQNWDWRHYTGTSIWRVATVNGIPFSARTTRHSLMAS